MKFPILDTVFGHTKVIHEIRGNASCGLERRPRSQARRGQAASSILNHTIPDPNRSDCAPSGLLLVH